MDFQLISKYPSFRRMYEEILSENWLKNYRINAPASSLQQLGKIFVEQTHTGECSTDYFDTSDKVESTASWLLFQEMNGYKDLEDEPYEKLGIDLNSQQKIFDYLPLEKILKIIDNNIVELAIRTRQIPDPDGDNIDWEAEEEKNKEGEQQWLEDQADAYDPYDGDEPPDLSEGDEPEHYEGDDYSDYAVDAQKQYGIDKQRKADKISMDSGKIIYKKILSLDWFKNYRKNPPASSLQELGDFSNYDEFEMEINSLIVNSFNENNFQTTPYQKLFDYLSLKSVFNLIYTFSQRLEFANESSISTLDEYSISTLDEYSTTPKLNDNKTISSLSQIRTKISDVKANENFSIECIVTKISDKREIQTRSGVTISLSEMFVEDDTGEIWVKGWRNQAKLMDKCELADIISITGLNAKENNLEKGRLELFLTSNTTISFKS